MRFRQIEAAEFPLIAPLMQTVLDGEDAFSLPANASTQQQCEYFFSGLNNEVWLAETDEGEIAGAYCQRANQAGLGSHIANGSYLVNPKLNGRGIGTQLGEHSLKRAKAKGYRGIQFNFVVSTNRPAIALWQKLGFDIIGTIPGGYHYRQQRYVDAYIMFRSLV